MLVADSASVTHAGRVRRNNEDAYLVDPPLFAVADGMGGALAGELASRLCIEAFRSVAPKAGERGEERLRRTILEANRRILARARDDPSASGMGSTTTACIVEGPHVAFGHVGDSRAYLLRDGTLQQLSRDHSLVAELVRQGRITPQEADTHPQRSVITRALGAASDLEVDTWSVEAREGDVYMLCSDGLSNMLDDARIATLLRADAPLADSLRSIVRAANDEGGDDNITAVAFRLGEPVAAVRSRDHDDTLTEEDGVPVVRLEPVAPRRNRRRHLRRAAITLVTLGLLAVLGAGAVLALRRAHFVGVDPQTGRVAVYSGLPLDLVAGHRLYHLVYRSDVLAATLPPAERRQLLDHTIRSDGDAMRVVRRLEVDQP